MLKRGFLPTYLPLPVTFRHQSNDVVAAIVTDSRITSS
jgi:hypothetical protein